MKILRKIHEDYILCTATKAEGKKQVVLHMMTYEYANQPYNAYDATYKGFKVARDYLQVKRLYDTHTVSKDYALSLGLNIIEVENELPKNVKKMKGVTIGY
jgi:hypothetical protein